MNKEKEPDATGEYLGNIDKAEEPFEGATGIKFLIYGAILMPIIGLVIFLILLMGGLPVPT